MQRAASILACFFIPIAIGSVRCFAQFSGPEGRFPFVHYTPRDGLISNEIRNIYQDSRGRLYFLSQGGLSVYDGARFTNYTSRNGLAFDIVNCAMEMADDSIWLFTNSAAINCLARGKMTTLHLEGLVPIVNSLLRDDSGIVYAATDQGLFYLEKDRFIKLPFVDTSGKDVNSYISYLSCAGKYLLVRRDNSNLSEGKDRLYLYNKQTRKITAQLSHIYAITASTDRRIWISGEKMIMSVDIVELSKGKLILDDLPSRFDRIKKLGRYFIQFDSQSNCWIGDEAHVLMKVDTSGNVTSFTTASGLSMPSVNLVFRDREGITWIATGNAGIDKFVQSNLAFIETPYNTPAPSEISYNEKSGRLLIYSNKNEKVALVQPTGRITLYKIEKGIGIDRLVETPGGIVGFGSNQVFRMRSVGNLLYGKMIHEDDIDNAFHSTLLDRNGNLHFFGGSGITSIIDGRIVQHTKLATSSHDTDPGRKPTDWLKVKNFADHGALDSKGNIWVANRAGDILVYEPQPGNDSQYMRRIKIFSNELKGASPRSILVDKQDNIWVGTRDNGIYAFRHVDDTLRLRFNLTPASGLSDKFITHLACDSDNNVWACSFSGLDKIFLRRESPVIENVTKQNNIYQGVLKVIVDRNNIVWGLLSNGVIRIRPETSWPRDYTPTLLISLMKGGQDTLNALPGARLSHQQNNLFFAFAATSFFNERQVLYSYRLRGGSGDGIWSVPSNNASVSFIGLQPADYMLSIKASFPAARYPDQTIQYTFSILPPWWQTWWFRGLVGLCIVVFVILAARSYYKRKLEKQMALLERQRAIEKERTRIATDMHDDLGAGLSRIKFLSQSILSKHIEDAVMQTELEKITSFSDEMSEKMGEIVWALNERNDTLADLVAYTRSYTVEYLANHNIECEANTPMHLPGTFITGEVRRNIFLSVKECLHNIVKHSGASRVCFSIHLGKAIEIIIHDNGKGIDWANRRAFSSGLLNIQQRMKEINGEAEFLNDAGTKVLLTISFPATS